MTAATAAASVAPLRARLLPESLLQPLPRRLNPVPDPPGEQLATIHRLIPRPTEPIPDPGPIAATVALAVMEVKRGWRQVSQLARWVSPRIYSQLCDEQIKPQPRPSPGLRLHRVRQTRPAPEALEASVVVKDGDRLRAVAIRFELRRGDWRATAIHVG